MELTYRTLKNNLKTVQIACEANLASLDAFYTNQPLAQREDYLAFKRLWDKHLHQELFLPRAVAKQLSKDEIAEFAFDFTDEILGGAEKVYAFVWTLGTSLEKRVQQFALMGDHIMALMLNVAGSVALRNIRLDIIKWLFSHSRGKARAVCAEHYPGLKVFPIKFVPRVLEITKASSLLGVSANEACFLTPIITKCAFFFLGRHARPTPPVRCIPCLYEKCSYWQMGGCHMHFLDNSPTH